MGPSAALFTALGTGVVCSLLGDWTLGRLSGSSADSSLEGDDLIGLEAEVTVPIAPGSTGKFPLPSKGAPSNCWRARPKAQGPLNPGDRVLVIEVRDGVAVVDPS